MRLIDADALIDDMCEDCGAIVNGVCDKDVCASVLWVKDAPAVDAVEVVRCKDCKYWGDEDGISKKDGIRFAWCNMHNHCMHGEYIGWCPKEDDFCSFGERREENEVD